jgi:rare lipoprotein A
MRSRVAGVFPPTVQPATWVAAIAVAAFWVAASLYVANHLVASTEPDAYSAPPRATIATEPTQIPNRAAKAAREAFKKEARLDEDIAGPNPEIVTPLPEDDGDDEGQTETGRSATLDAFKQEARLDEDIAGPNPEIVTPLPEDNGDEGQTETGRASWYDLDSKTASGEAMDPTALTAAHPSLPLGTQVRVVNLENDRAVVVRINDRGPFADNRIIDLSKAAAAELDMVEAGVAEVRVTPIAAVMASN